MPKIRQRSLIAISAITFSILYSTAHAESRYGYDVGDHFYYQISRTDDRLTFRCRDFEGKPEADSFHHTATNVAHATFDSFKSFQATTWQDYLRDQDIVRSFGNKTSTTGFQNVSEVNVSQNGFKGRIVGYYNLFDQKIKTRANKNEVQFGLPHPSKYFDGTKAAVSHTHLFNSIFTDDLVNTQIEWQKGSTTQTANGIRMDWSFVPAQMDGEHTYIYDSTTRDILTQQLGFVSSAYDNFIAWKSANRNAHTQSGNNWVNAPIYFACSQYIYENGARRTTDAFNKSESYKGKLGQNTVYRNVAYNEDQVFDHRGHIPCGGMRLFLPPTSDLIKRALLKDLLTYAIGWPISQMHANVGPEGATQKNNAVSFIQFIDTTPDDVTQRDVPKVAWNKQRLIQLRKNIEAQLEIKIPDCLNGSEESDPTQLEKDYVPFDPKNPNKNVKAEPTNWQALKPSFSESQSEPGELRYVSIGKISSFTLGMILNQVTLYTNSIDDPAADFRFQLAEDGDFPKYDVFFGPIASDYSARMLVKTINENVAVQATNIGQSQIRGDFLSEHPYTDYLKK